jgi:uncharacterized protein (TIGR01777 family)
MKVLISGGTGFIGQSLVHALLSRGDKVCLLVRNHQKAKKIFQNFFLKTSAIKTSTIKNSAVKKNDIEKNITLVESLTNLDEAFDAVINLAGEPIVDKRWTPSRKKTLINSRIETTKAIVDWVNTRDQKPQVFISASAIGYYGNHPENKNLDESAESRACFSSDLCRQWEAEANKLSSSAVRVCTVRIGVVLEKNGGALQRMLMPYRMGMGGVMGSGQQWFSWIHRDDMIALLLFLLDVQTISGPVNATAPNPVSHKILTKSLAKALSRPAFLPMPSWLVKILFGEASELLIEGQKVYPAKLLNSGYAFLYPELEPALNDILNK